MDGEISKAELKAACANGQEPLIIDIRSPLRYQQEHIEGSVNIPLAQLPAEIERVADEDHIVTVCPHGKTSIRAAQLITSFQAFEGRVESLSCGLSGWDGPVTTAEGNQSNSSPNAPF